MAETSGFEADPNERTVRQALWISAYWEDRSSIIEDYEQHEATLRIDLKYIKQSSKVSSMFEMRKSARS